MRHNWTRIARAVFSLSILAGISSCDVKFQEDVRGPIEVGFYAGGGAQTRTEMLSNGLSAAWTAGDELAVWARNSSGSYILAKQKFQTYGINASLGYFSSTLAAEMADGTYTYMCCYPVPNSVDGTKVTFNLSENQDGKASGGADIMIANPVTYGPLSVLPDPDDHSSMSMRMNRMMHQFRYWLPEGYNTTGEPVSEIFIEMPQAIAGTVTADFTDPTVAPTLSNGVSSMRLELAEPITESSSLESASFACASVFPYTGTYTDSDFMNLQVYTDTYKMSLDPISLSGRTFAAGHSTPVRILPTSVDKYYRLTLKIGENYIGEALTNVSILFDGATYYGFSNAGGPYSNFTNFVEAYNDEGKAEYDKIIAAVEGGTATYIYETEHALVTKPITADMMSYDGNKILIDLGDVPYLIYEDFSNAQTVVHDDDYSGGADTDRNLTGYLLNGYMPQDGWNAARFNVMGGDLIRINCRYESGAGVYARYCGRLDSPALSYLKSGVSVDVVVEFDEAFDIPIGYYIDDSANSVAKYHVGYHTNSQTSAIDGCKSGNLGDQATYVYTSPTHADENVAILNPASVTIPSAGPSTRVGWFVDTEQKSIKLGANSIYYLYIDNIRIYIK